MDTLSFMHAHRTFKKGPQLCIWYMHALEEEHEQTMKGEKRIGKHGAIQMVRLN